MNATILAQAAYSASAAPLRTSRGTEHDVFSKITRRLRQSNSAGGYAGFVQALHDNRQLWTLLAVDVADQDNGLPQQLRAQIFYLAEFTLLHTSKVLAGEAGPEALIDINNTIMQGLRQPGRPT